jgi:hypothetical protein
MLVLGLIAVSVTITVAIAGSISVTVAIIVIIIFAGVIAIAGFDDHIDIFVTGNAIAVFVPAYYHRIRAVDVFAPVDDLVGPEDLIAAAAAGYRKFLIYFADGQQVAMAFLDLDLAGVGIAAIGAYIFGKLDPVVVITTAASSVIGMG